MEEELLRQILRELQNQSGTSFLDFLQLMAPAAVGLIAGLAGAGVGIYSVKRSSESQIETVRLASQAERENLVTDRLLTWRRERYEELTDALAEYVAGLSKTVSSAALYAVTLVEDDQDNLEDYLVSYHECRKSFESIRASERLMSARLKVANAAIGEAVSGLAKDADALLFETLGEIQDIIRAHDEADAANEEHTAWPKKHESRQEQIVVRAHQINEQVEALVSAV